MEREIAGKVRSSDVFSRARVPPIQCYETFLHCPLEASTGFEYHSPPASICISDFVALIYLFVPKLGPFRAYAVLRWLYFRKVNFVGLA